MSDTELKLTVAFAFGSDRVDGVLVRSPSAQIMAAAAVKAPTM